MVSENHVIRESLHGVGIWMASILLIMRYFLGPWLYMMVLAYMTLSEGYLISLCILLVMLLLFVGEPDTELKLSCRQRSPFLQNNYRDSSFKQLFFVYTVSILFIKWICISKSCAAFVTRENIISESMWNKTLRKQLLEYLNRAHFTCVCVCFHTFSLVDGPLHIVIFQYLKW